MQKICVVAVSNIETMEAPLASDWLTPVQEKAAIENEIKSIRTMSQWHMYTHDMKAL